MVRNWLDAANDRRLIEASVGSNPSLADIVRMVADQLLLPMALGQGGSFTTCANTEHLRSNALIIERFTARRVTISKSAEGFVVRVSQDRDLGLDIT